MYFVSNDGVRLLIPERVRRRLPEIMQDILQDVPGEDIPVPFSGDVVSMAINQHRDVYDFERWPDVIACCSFLGVDVSERCQMLSHIITMEIVRASGHNLFHFDEASLFMNVLYTRDKRLIPVDRVEVEKMYWMLLKCSDMTQTVQEVLGVERYDQCVEVARTVQKQLDRPHHLIKTVRAVS